ncbi:MAG TPA: cytochrome c1, partial [Alphaproteobacteria bacterium]|nr:cytochrome c1 [Alphaproteobacteria bacterium]
AGPWISMAPPLMDDLIEYADGTPATTSQMAQDVAAFLAWSAEPKAGERKATGLRVMIFLIIFAILLYASYKRLWRNIDH